MAGVDEIIDAWVRQAENSGELQRGPYWGKPFDFKDGLLETPDHLRMAYKVLKNAGYVPAEVELLNTLATLKEQLVATTDPREVSELRVQIAECGQKVAIMMERVNHKR